jgi:hypothetical protein
MREVEPSQIPYLGCVLHREKYTAVVIISLKPSPTTIAIVKIPSLRRVEHLGSIVPHTDRTEGTLRICVDPEDRIARMWFVSYACNVPGRQTIDP